VVATGPADRLARLMAWQRRNGPVVLLGAALVGAAVMLAVAQWGVTFFQDTWAFLLDRQDFSADAILAPHNEHIVVVPVLITKALLAVFGMSSNTPEQVAMALTLFAAAILLFLYVRRRTDAWIAALAATLLLFLGSAWPVLIWPFENEFTIPIVFGLAMLLALDRDDPRGDAWACAALLVAILSGSLGLSFIVAAAAHVFLARKERGWGRAYVFVVPLLVYLAWYAGWGHEAEKHLTLHNVLASPAYVMEGFASALDSLAGLSTIPVNSPGKNDWGRPLLIGAIALVAFGQWRRPGVSRGFWVVAAAAVTYWLLAAFNFIPGREASASRYVYAGAVFVLLMAAELLRGVRWSPRALVVAAIVVACAIGPNLAQLKDGSEWEKQQSVLTRADLAALEIARGHVDPSFTLGSFDVAGTASLAIVEAGEYFEAVDRWGSPAYTPAELEEAPQHGRHYADIVLSQALPLTTSTEAGTSLARAGGGGGGQGCVTQAAGSDTSEVELGPGVARIEVAAGPEAHVSLRRFAEGEYPVKTTPAAGGSTMLLRVPRDRAPQPWHLHVEASQTVRVCPA
jgi:hypothetical protein